MNFPQKIKIPSDDTELELKELSKVQVGYEKDRRTPKYNILGAIYVYTKAEYFMGTEITFSNEQFEASVRKTIIVILD